MFEFDKFSIKSVELLGLNIRVEFNACEYYFSSIDLHFDSEYQVITAFHDLVYNYDLDFYSKIGNREIWLGCHSELKK